MVNLSETENVYDRYPTLRGNVMYASVADVILRLEAERDRLRAALGGLIGADSADELRIMEAAIRMTPAPAADKAVMLDAIHALLERNDHA